MPPLSVKAISCCRQACRPASICSVPTPIRKTRLPNWSKANNSRVTTNTFTIYRLNVVVDAAGNGTVYSQPSGINCSISSNCEIPFLSGDTVTLTQAAKTTSSFANWSGACTGTASTCTVTMNADKNVVARYTFLPNYTLTVSKAGTGAGTSPGTR